jgi:hypothetical protein
MLSGMANTDNSTASTDSKPQKSKPTYTPVQVNREAPIDLHAAHAIRPDGSIEWRNKGGGLNTSDVIRIWPGWNLIPTEKWERCKVQDSTKALVVEVIRGSRAAEGPRSSKVGAFVLVEGKPVSMVKPLGGMAEKDAIEFVSDCLMKPILDRLLTAEDRPEVQVALRKKLLEIEKPALETRYSA